MFHIEELSRIPESIRSKERPRRLMPSDCSVLIALMCYMDKSTHKAKVTHAQLARDLGAGRSNITASVTRLRREMLVASHYDRVTGERYFMLNPHLFSTGKTERRPVLFKKFMELINE